MWKWFWEKIATAGKGTAGQDTAAAVGPTSSEPEVLLDRLPPEVLLDRLPPELLLHIFSWLDWLSLVALESVSARCKEAVALYLGRLRLFTVDGSLWETFCAVQRPGLLPRIIGRMYQPSEPSSALTALLSMMVNLRELHVDVNSTVERPQGLLRAVVSASHHWPQLERLELTWDSSDRLDRYRLRELCTNCDQLTSVTLIGGFGDDEVEAVVSKVPALRTLCVRSPINTMRGSLQLPNNLRGSFLSKLPTDLHNLSVVCDTISSWPLSDLFRCRELRSLELEWGHNDDSALNQVQLVSVLVGCVHLETLYLHVLDETFVACLPPDGLPTLRHLTIEFCYLNDADFDRLVERLPGLESVSPGWCCFLSPQGLAPLGRLTSVRVLRLNNPSIGVSDSLLTQLSAAPLVELQLPVERLLDHPTCTRMGIPKTFSVDRLLHLTRCCKSLRVLVLSARITGRDERISISCGAGVQERDVEQSIRLFVDSMARLLSENDVARQNQ